MFNVIRSNSWNRFAFLLIGVAISWGRFDSQSILYAADEEKAAASPATISTSKLELDLANEWVNDVAPFIKKYCIDCHSGEMPEGSVDLAKFTSLEAIRSNPSLFEQVRSLIRVGAMPPKSFDEQPIAQERDRVSNWLYMALNAVDCGIPFAPPPVTVRRLNRQEYDNTIRDLFGVDLYPSREVGFVSDDVGNGFDNQGEVLSISPLVFEKYVQAAEFVTSKVVSLDPRGLQKQTFNTDPINVGQSFTASFLAAKGRYRIKTRLQFGDNQNGEVPVDIYMDDTKLDSVTVNREGKNHQWEVEVVEGAHQVRVRFVDDPDTQQKGNLNRRLTINNVVCEGPLNGGDPPYPIAHQRIMVATADDRNSPEQAARAIIQNILPKAYRRPVTELEVQEIVAVIQNALNQEFNLEQSVQFGLQAILLSPNFLFRMEDQGNDVDGSEQSTALKGNSELVGDYELATRLSYFLWSTMPDEDLMSLASAGGLANPHLLRTQVDRMMEDAKADALVDGFFSQWLGLRNLKTVDVDDKTFPVWSEKLQAAMAEETRLFCKSLMREGELSDVIDGNYTFVNPRLADFYGIPFEGNDAASMYINSSVRRGRFAARKLGRYRDEDRWVKIELPEQRRGLLTQASILTLTSNPTRTSPVKRGKWVLENVLGDPPPPAPPGVPSLEKSSEGKENLTLRQQLELHRADPGCASCHKVLDPIGLGLENFDAIGRWRTMDGKSDIDSQGELADGRRFNGPRELLQHLKADRDKIAKHFASKLLTYALGRGLTRSDQCAVEAIVAYAKERNYKVSEFIYAVVTSKPFLYKAVR